MQMHSTCLLMHSPLCLPASLIHNNLELVSMDVGRYSNGNDVIAVLLIMSLRFSSAVKFAFYQEFK